MVVKVEGVVAVSAAICLADSLVVASLILLNSSFYLSISAVVSNFAVKLVIDEATGQHISGYAPVPDDDLLGDRCGGNALLPHRPDGCCGRGRLLPDRLQHAPQELHAVRGSQVAPFSHF